MNLYQNTKFYVMLCVLIVFVQFVWFRLPRSRNETSSRGSRRLNFFFCFCTAVAVGTLLHLYPGNHLYPTGDSAAFIYIGKRMLAGKVPYLDVFDHKGPALYFIQCLGLAVIPHGTSGLWLVEVVNMAVTLLLLMRVCFLAAERRSSGWLALLMAFIACGWRIYEGGNFTEEYALPWISFALLVFYRFFKTGTYRNRDIVLLGISFSVVFLLRANMIAVWAACIPVVLLYFVIKKSFRDIGICIGLFFLGILAGAVPFLFYIVYNHALQEFVACYFSFNFLYSAEVGLDVGMVFRLGKIFSLLIFPGLLALLISTIRNRKSFLRWLNLWCFTVSFLMLEMSGRDYPHYLITLLPILAFSFADAFDWTATLLTKNDPREPACFVLILSCIAIFLGSIGYHIITGKKEWPEIAIIPWLRENTNEDDDVLILGNDAWTYLATDRTTDNRYFYQLPPIEISSSIRKDFLEELAEHPSDFVIDPTGNPEHAEDWREETYHQLMLEGYRYQQIDGFGIYIRPQIDDDNLSEEKYG